MTDIQEAMSSKGATGIHNLLSQLKLSLNILELQMKSEKKS